MLAKGVLHQPALERRQGERNNVENMQREWPKKSAHRKAENVASVVPTTNSLSLASIISNLGGMSAEQ